MPSVHSAIDLAAIEEQLKNARVQTGGATATTINLIVYVDEPALQQRAHQKAKQLSEKYPARVMMLHTDAESAKVSTSVRKIGEGTTIHAEMIELGVANMQPEAICSAINTLRVVDIQNVLWWTSETVANEALFDAIITLMDTVIVDSSGIDPTEAAIRELTDFYSLKHPILIHDLAYMRLAPWQDMVAQFFDDETFLADLHRIERVEITSGSAAEGYYLVGWLASRLNWKPCGRFELCDEHGGRIQVVMKRDGDLRRVLRITLSTSDSSFCAELTDSPDTVCLTVTGPKSNPQRCSPLQHIDNMSLLEKAFVVIAHDEVFEASLGVIFELLKY